MLSAEFELIIEQPSNLTEGVKSALREGLKSQAGLKVIEVDELLKDGQVVIQRHANQEQLTLMHNAIQAVGGQQLIVRPVNIQNTDQFSYFYAKYARRLYDSMQQLDLQPVQRLIDDLLAARSDRRQIFVIGNGGSAATASHMANDFSKHRFKDSSLNFRIISLTDNMSWITATANDEGYDFIFVNQLQNLMEPGDVVVAISSSGNSRNVTKAVEYANDNGASTHGIVGFNGGDLQRAAQSSIYIPTKVGQYGFHEDISMIINHMISIYIYEQDKKALSDKE